MRRKNQKFYREKRECREEEMSREKKMKHLQILFSTTNLDGRQNQTIYYPFSV